MGGALIPVVDHEKSWTERGNEQDAASKAHRAFQDPHSLHRGSAPENDVARDTGVGVVRKGTSKLVKNEKGQWVKPRHDRPIVVGDAAAPSAETAGKRDRDRPERFIPAKAWVGERSGYYFARGREGVGYYADDAQGDERWRETWRRLKEKEAEAREARREETRRGGEERRREDARDPDDYHGGKRYGGDRGDDYRGEKRPRGRDDWRDDRRDDRRDRSRDRYRRRSRSRSRSRDRGGDDDARRRGGGGGDGDGDRDRDRDGGGGSKPMTKAEKEAAALARLAAKRGGGGARVGGIPAAPRPGSGFRGGGRSF